LIKELHFDKITVISKLEGEDKVLSAAQRLVTKSSEICELFLNTVKAKNAILNEFSVHLTDFKENLQNTSIRFADWATWNTDPNNKTIALSWIDKYKVDKILLNHIFLKRFLKTRDLEEQERIFYVVGMVIFHELGHVAMQLTHDSKYIICLFVMICFFFKLKFYNLMK
jgi:hypothetical protein